ncbi:WD40 repeat-like protein [Myriangium duriaei CBS 260.36]|uniref:WD40 repeat-like protein n=1 Tax=Myriangium duriaei CBS 260.36 TaxID=1168546 RepID=A0A9P4MJW9_9PEZI|nr:WD40 repeat-like protein [Myriangium duriaei CBS 260.36]
MELVSSSNIPCTPDGEHPTLVAGALSSNAKYVSAALTDSSLHVFSIDGSHKLKVTDPSGNIIWAHMILDDDILVSGSSDGILRAYNIADGRLLDELPPIKVSSNESLDDGRDRNPGAIRRLYYLHSKPGSVFVTTVSGSIHQWETGSTNYRHDFLGGHSSTIFDIKPFAEGTRFVSMAPRYQSLAAWDVVSGTMLWTNTQDSDVFSIAIAHERVVFGREDGVIKIARLEDGMELAAFNAHKGLINGIIFSNNLFISTDVYGFAKVWSMPAGDVSLQLVRSEKLYDHAVTARCMLGSWLVTAGKHGGAADNVCGLDYRMKICKVHGDEQGDGLESPREIGLPVMVIWGIASLHSLRSVATAVMKRGRPVLEIWKKL